MAESIASPGAAKQHVLLPRVVAWLGLPLSLLALRFVPDPTAGAYGLMATLALLFVLYFGPRPAPALSRAPAAAISFTDEHVVIRAGSGERRVAKRSLEGGWIESWGGEHRVALRRRGGDVEWIRAESEDAARRILTGAGVAPSQHLLRWQLVSRLSERYTATQRDGVLFAAAGLGLFAAVVLGVVAMAGPIGLAAAAVMLIAMLYPVLRWITPRTVVVGTDGVTLRGVGTKEFVPWTSIEKAHADERGVLLTRHADRDILLATSPNPGRVDVDPTPSPAAKALFDRMRDAMAEGRKSTDADARYAVLDRNGRSLDQWRTDLRALGTRPGGAAGYRSSWLERHELAEVLGDAGASAERRIAAAIALSASEEPALADRIRVTVETCANEKLRVAIDGAARGEIEDAELEDALQADAETAAR